MNVEKFNLNEVTKAVETIEKYRDRCHSEDPEGYEEGLLRSEKEEEDNWDEIAEVAKAIGKARKAFEDHFGGQGLDSGYWRLKLVVERLDQGLSIVLNRTTFEEVA